MTTSTRAHNQPTVDHCHGNKQTNKQQNRELHIRKKKEKLQTEKDWCYKIRQEIKIYKNKEKKKANVWSMERRGRDSKSKMAVKGTPHTAYNSLYSDRNLSS